jgi:hypothetical protein
VQRRLGGRCCASGWQPRRSEHRGWRRHTSGGRRNVEAAVLMCLIVLSFVATMNEAFNKGSKK